MTTDEIKRIRVKNLVAHRVVNQTRMGKIQSLYYLTIAGNQNGMVGIGEGKAVEDEDGRRQAMMNAIRNMRPIARYEERTIFGEVEGKVGAAVVRLSSRPPGTFDTSFLSPEVAWVWYAPLFLLICRAHRFRQPLPTPDLRTGAGGGDFGLGGAHAPVAESDECRQGGFSGAHQAAAARGCGQGAGAEDGRCEECLLRGAGALMLLLLVAFAVGWVC